MSKKFSLKEIAAVTGDKLQGNENIEISGVASLEEASGHDLSFFGNKKYEHQLQESSAAVFIVPEDYDKAPPEGKAFLYSSNVDVSFSKVIMMFAPEPAVYPAGIHPTAFVDPSASIGNNVHVGPQAVIDAEAKIGDNSIVCAGSYVGQQSSIGSDSLIYQNVTIRERCTIGDRCIIHSGTVVGADGFGFVPGKQGIVKIPQVGIVEIRDDVEIGANTCIDRARFGKTILKTGVKVDNLVQIAHNVEVGEFTLLIGQSGIAGSAKLGKGCIIAGRAGVNGHITLGDGCKVAGTSNVPKSLPPGSIAVGTPAEPQRDFMARLALPKKVAKLQAKVKELEKVIKTLSEK